jgi:predicted MFS family arabinose efflux permease
VVSPRPEREAVGSTARGYGRDFRLFATGQAVSLVGDRIALIALVFLVIRQSGSYAPALALFYIARVAPTLAGGLIAGYIADSVDRKTLLIAADVTRGVLLGLVPAVTTVSLATLYPIVIVLYGFTVLFTTTARAMLPDVVAEERMTAANALLVRLETGADLAYVVGGALIAALPIAASFYLDAFTFGASALAISAMRIPSPRAALEQTLAGVARRIRDGLTYLLSEPFLKWSTISSIPAPICVGGVFVLSPLYASHVLSHSAGLAGPLVNGAFRFSVLEVAIGLGGLLGTVVAPRLARAMARGAIFALGMTGFGVVIGLLAFISNMYLAVIVMSLSGLSNSLVQVAGSTLLQALTPSQMRGRVMSARITIIQTGLGVGAALAGWLLVWLPVHTIWLVLAALMLFAALLAWWNPDARRQT